MNLLPPQPGDDQRAEDILDEIHILFTRTNCRLFYDERQRCFTIDNFRNPRVMGVEVPVIGGRWYTISRFDERTGQWQHVAEPDMATLIVRGMLSVISVKKAHLVMNTAKHQWILAIADEFGQYRGIAELSQITPKRFDWRPIVWASGGPVE